MSHEPRPAGLGATPPRRKAGAGRIVWHMEVPVGVAGLGSRSVIAVRCRPWFARSVRVTGAGRTVSVGVDCPHSSVSPLEVDHSCAVCGSVDHTPARPQWEPPKFRGSSETGTGPWVGSDPRLKANGVLLRSLAHATTNDQDRIMVMRTSETDYLVVGAGAMGMAFTDALIDHADVHVTLVDRRHAASGHWNDAYPFVQLHQASQFYGVASTVLGTGALQDHGPEAGLGERACQSEIRAYYDDVLHRRFLGSGRVSFLGGCEYHAEGTDHLVTSRVSGETVRVDVRRRVVDATYLAPTIPANTPPPFAVADGVPVIPINALATIEAAASHYVIVGAGKTATDGIVWLITKGVAPDRITWVRPRDPWMLHRAVVQPDPVVALGLAADTLTAAAEAESLDDFFRRLESAGVMLRVDPNVLPTMAKAPTLGAWVLVWLRTIVHVVRIRLNPAVYRTEIVFAADSVPLAPGSIVVHCAASGLAYPTMVPLWDADTIRLQTIRAGFPCFGAALAGYVEATRDDDRERNRLCPPNLFPDSLASWARMQVRGAHATRTFGAEPDIAEWANGCALNPARIQPSQRADPAVQAAAARVADVMEPGIAALETLAQ